MMSIALGACSFVSVPHEPSAAEAIRIESTFGLLESLQVEYVQLQDGCQSLIYSRGAYSEAGRQDPCYVHPEIMSDFDRQASADYAAVRKAFADTDVTILLVRLTIDGSRRLTGGSFDMGCNSPCEVMSYVYESDGSIDDEMRDIPPNDWGQLNDHWWWSKEQ